MASHFTLVLISIAADSTFISPEYVHGEDPLLAFVRAAAAAISAVAAALATFFAYRSFSANKTKTKSDYYQRTVAIPSESRIDAFRKEVTDLLNSHEDEFQPLRGSDDTRKSEIKGQVKETRTRFGEHIANLKYHLRGAAASSKNRALTEELLDAVDRVETDVMVPLEKTDKQVDDEVFDWRVPLTQSTGRLLSIIREHDPMLRE